jgi:hypothetical protein
LASQVEQPSPSQPRKGEGKDIVSLSVIRERRAMEMSLRQIAKELGITPAYLSYMVNGKRPWREDLYQRYCQLVNTKSLSDNPGGSKSNPGTS